MLRAVALAGCGVLGTVAFMLHPDPTQFALVVAVLVALSAAASSGRFPAAPAVLRVPVRARSRPQSRRAAPPATATAPQQLLLSKPRR